MHLMVQFSCDGVVPRERFGPRSQLFVGTTTEQRAEQLMAHGQVVQNLQHIDEYRNWHGKQNQ